MRYKTGVKVWESSSNSLFHKCSWGGDTEDCHGLLLNVITFLLVLSRQALCSDNGWDPPEKLPLLLPRRRVCLECLFLFLFISFGQVPWKSQQLQKLMLFILTCSHFEKAQNKKHQQLQMRGIKNIQPVSPPNLFKVPLQENEAVENLLLYLGNWRTGKMKLNYFG